MNGIKISSPGLNEEIDEKKIDRLYKYIIKYRKLVNESISNPAYSIELEEKVIKEIIEYNIKNYEDSLPFLKLRKIIIYFWK